MMKKRSEMMGIVIAILLILGSSVLLYLSHQHRIEAKNDKTEQSAASTKKATKESDVKVAETTKESTAETTASSAENSVMRTPIDWQESSQTTDYPTLADGDWIKVSIVDQRTYLMRGNDILYTMYCSTGVEGDNATPTGEFVIEPEKGESFYNDRSGEGANYWVSFKDHGVYLFHTVPVDQNGDYLEAEGAKLGLEASSHGCIRLSIPDAKWMFDNAIVGMKVVIG